MVEMNSYYAHESQVGPVFDAATHSRRKGVMTGAAGLVMGALLAVATIYAWDPDWLIADPPSWLSEAQQEVKDLWRLQPRWTPIGVGIGGSLGALFLTMGCVYIVQALTCEFYVRVGEGGISLCVPEGFGKLQLDLPWEEIDQLTVVQEKQLGALSRNAGNIGAYLDLRTHTHGRRNVRLDDFREPGHLIHSRIMEASETRSASMCEAVQRYGELAASASNG
jgi:hypothetical protein